MTTMNGGTPFAFHVDVSYPCFAEIAFLLGYDEPNSFARAFHSWTGETPHAARQSVAR